MLLSIWVILLAQNRGVDTQAIGTYGLALVPPPRPIEVTLEDDEGTRPTSFPDVRQSKRVQPEGRRGSFLEFVDAILHVIVPRLPPCVLKEIRRFQKGEFKMIFLHLRHPAFKMAVHEGS